MQAFIVPCPFRGMRLEFLPAYSPDFNPIELAFSLLKSRLRRAPLPEGGGDAAIYARLYGEVMSIGVAVCCAFYEHCGYGWYVVFIHFLVGGMTDLHSMLLLQL